MIKLLARFFISSRRVLATQATPKVFGVGWVCGLIRRWLFSGLLFFITQDDSTKRVVILNGACVMKDLELFDGGLDWCWGGGLVFRSFSEADQDDNSKVSRHLSW